MQKFCNGSRICFIGDSLTAHNEVLPRIIDKYNKLFSNEDIEFFNCGTSGGTLASAYDFFRDDVLRHNPTHAVIAYAINDSERWHLANQRSAQRYELLENAFCRFKKNLSKYCELLESHNIKIILCTPAPYDEYSNQASIPLKGCYALTQGYADFIRSYAESHGYELCDYNKYLSEIIAKTDRLLYADDRIHPNAYGYYHMANCFFEFQGFTTDVEHPIPEYLEVWRKEVKKLRVIFGAEHMIVKNYAMPTEEKMIMMQKIIEEKNWGAPVLEGFVRGFVAEKLNQEALYSKIDELYANEIKYRYK